jgi:DNA end-binding protein Ku
MERQKNLACGGSSPLLPPSRLVGQAEPRSAARKKRAPARSTATSRLPKAVTSHRTPNSANARLVFHDGNSCVVRGNCSMRAIWKGAISFGLVNIPVGLYSATRPANEIKFRLLRDSDHSPVKYKRTAEADGKEVPWEHIVKGFEYEKDQFIVLDEKDFERVNIKSNQTVDIKEFVALEEIDPMFFDQPYFLAPEKGGDKAYVLLREALEKSGKVGIAKVTIKTREHLAAVKPLDGALVLELMHFAEELADTNELSLPKNVDAGKKELAMAESLIKGMTDKWEPEKYKDEYREALMKVIEEKMASGGKELPAQKATAQKASNVVDLVSILQQSLDQTKGSAKTKRAKATGKKHRKAA